MSSHDGAEGPESEGRGPRAGRRGSGIWRPPDEAEEGTSPLLGASVFLPVGDVTSVLALPVLWESRESIF